MSKRVIFAGLSFSILGLIMCKDLVFAGFGPQRAHYTLWLGALFFPAGTMLLLGIAVSRPLLSVLLSVFYLVWAKVLVITALASDRIFEQIGPLAIWGEGPGIYQAVLIIRMAAFLIIPLMMMFHWMLYTKPFDEHLD